MKSEPDWLSVDVVLAMHEELINDFGREPVIRDRGLLEAALARPRNRFAYDECDLFDLAAAYAHGIVRNHPFVDGNKRVAFLAAYAFLDLHGWMLRAPESEAAVLTNALAARSRSEADYAEWLRRSCVIKSREAAKRGKRPPRRPA